MTVNGVKVEHPTYFNEKWYCPECGKKVNIYDEDPSFYYTKCECGCLIANKNFMEARAE